MTRKLGALLLWDKPNLLTENKIPSNIFRWRYTFAFSVLPALRFTRSGLRTKTFCNSRCFYLAISASSWLDGASLPGQTLAIEVPKGGVKFWLQKESLQRHRGLFLLCCLKTFVKEQGTRATSLQILVYSYALNHRCHHEFDVLPKNVFSPYYLSTAGMKSPCLGNKCWSKA